MQEKKDFFFFGVVGTPATSPIMLALLSSAASISAAPLEEWLPMPDGRLYHHTCVHRQDDAVKVLPGSLPPCPYLSRSAAPEIEAPNYYSDWAVYAQMASPNGFSLMSSTFTVPPAPKSRGPAGLSSVYLFNGTCGTQIASCACHF